MSHTSVKTYGLLFTNPKSHEPISVFKGTGAVYCISTRSRLQLPRLAAILNSSTQGLADLRGARSVGL